MTKKKKPNEFCECGNRATVHRVNTLICERCAKIERSRMQTKRKVGSRREPWLMYTSVAVACDVWARKNGVEMPIFKP